MTVQLPEQLWYQGQTLAMASTPLEDYFVLLGERPCFQPTSAALSRGYVGSWELRDGRLYLMGLRGWLEGGQAASLAVLFPGFAERVFAHWYHGTLRISRGHAPDNAPRVFQPVHQDDLLIDLEAGVLQSEHRLQTQ